jgi:predicted small integral membrane protein
MNEGKRPGGLTALAIINFVFCGFSMLSLLGMVAFFAFIDMVPTDQMDARQKTQIEAVQNMGTAALVLILVLNLVTAALLLTSGIGYLQQKKVLGRTIGNVYAIISIIAAIVSGLMFKPELGGGFNIGSIIGLVYPVVTLILLNTTFKDDLTN